MGLVFSAVEERRNLSADEFQRVYLDQQRPVLIKEGVADWPAISRWCDDQKFVARAGDVQIPLFGSVASQQLDDNIRYSYGTHLRTSGGTAVHKNVDLQSALKLIEHPSEDDFIWYLRQLPIPKGSQLLEDFSAPLYLPRNNGPKGGPYLWMAGRKFITHLHWDGNPGLNCQVRGKKRWILLSPDQAHLAYPVRFGLRSITRLLRVHSLSRRWLLSPFDGVKGINAFLVDAQAPDYTRFPRFRDANPLECVMEPGDVLFIPVQWLHSVTPLSDLCVSLNWWFDHPVSNRRWLELQRVGFNHYGLRDTHASAQGE